MSEATQSFIDARSERVRAVMNTSDLEKAMAFFRDDAKITNYGFDALDWTVDQQRTYLKDNVFPYMKFEMTTVGTYGNKEFSAWEWTSVVTVLQDSPQLPWPAGSKQNMRGVTMLWYDMSEGGDGKITKMTEYNKFS